MSSKVFSPKVSNIYRRKEKRIVDAKKKKQNDDVLYVRKCVWRGLAGYMHALLEYRLMVWMRINDKPDHEKTGKKDMVVH